MKKSIHRILILSILMLSLIAVFMLRVMAEAEGPFAGGNGSPESPYRIETAEQLATVAEAVYLDQHFVLADNIDLDAAPYNTGDGWLPIGTEAAPFTGSFDGGGYTIAGLFIDRGGADYQGLFGYIGSSSVIQSVELVDVDIIGRNYAGTLVGYNDGGAITGCCAGGSVRGLCVPYVPDAYYIGGLVGYNSQGTIADSYTTGAVTAGYQSRYIGGLVGSNSGTVIASFATGTVTGGNESRYIGGLVGENGTGSRIEDSYATGAVTGLQGIQYFSYYIGGLVGSNSGTVSASYATGAVTGDIGIGGLVGDNESYILNCYATGSVLGRAGIGGLVGDNHSVISNSYAVGSVSGQVSIGGLVGHSDDGTVIDSYYDSNTTGQSDTGKGQPKSTVEMKQRDTFVGWNFMEQSMWKIFENNNYPVLWWQPFTTQEIDAMISIDRDALEIIYAEGDSADRVTSDLTLPQTGSNGTTISWSSSNVLVIADDGTITMPGGNSTVTMTATISMAGGTDQVKEFQLNVEVIVIPTYVLTINSGTGGSISTGSYAEGTVINISASPNSGYEFNKWTTTNGGIFGNANSASTTFIMPANATTITAIFTYTGSGRGGNGGGGSDSGSDETQTSGYVYIPVVASSGNITTVPKLDRNTGAAAVSIDTATLTKAFEKSAGSSDGMKSIVITIPEVEGAKAYESTLPASALSSSGTDQQLSIKSSIASVILPGSMLEGIDEGDGKEAAITIGEGDKSLLPDDVKKALGDRPLVQLSLTLDRKQAEWNNPDAPVTVSIPYTPTAQELANPEHITIWYIDGGGNVVSVPNGRYDPASSSVIFTTTHFSHYAVAYVTKSFNDLGGEAWAKKPIEVLASKGILKGTSEKEYSPKTNITRADFLYYLVRALGADARPDGNFVDISSGAYYYREIGTARKLGITGGTGNNRFNPDANITRQDMMVLTERALRMLKKFEVKGSASELDKFSDKSLVADYAVEGVASIVKEGLIIGSGGRINSLGSTTRAEAAVFLYRIYNRF